MVNQLVSRLMISYFDILGHKGKIDGLVLERCNSSALAMELRLSCINPSRCPQNHFIFIMGIPTPQKNSFYNENSLQFL